MNTSPFPGVKRPARGVEEPPPSNAEVTESRALYLYSISGPSWPVLGQTYLRATDVSQTKFISYVSHLSSQLPNGRDWRHILVDPATPHYTISTYVLLLQCCMKHNSLVLSSTTATLQQCVGACISTRIVQPFHEQYCILTVYVILTLLVNSLVQWHQQILKRYMLKDCYCCRQILHICTWYSSRTHTNCYTSGDETHR